MPKRRTPGDAPRSTSIDPFDDRLLFPGVVRLIEAGIAAVTCFTAWLWTQTSREEFLSPPRFRSLAPNPFLAETMPDFLALHGLLVQHSVQQLAVGAPAASARRWRLADDLGNFMDAEFMGSVAIARLRAGPSFVEDACEVWRILAAAELVGFLGAELSDHHFDEAWALEIEASALGIVDSLSIARGFYFCWLAVRDLASAYLRFPGARERLPHTLKDAFDSKLRKAHSEGWSIRDSARHLRSPESAVASVFSTVVTELRGNYLLLPVCPDNLRL